jgi:hypothetical protein
LLLRVDEKEEEDKGQKRYTWPFRIYFAALAMKGLERKRKR